MPTGHPSLGSPFAHRYLVVLAVPIIVGLLTLLWFFFVRYVPQQLVQGRRTFQSAMRARVAGELGWTLMGNMLRTMDIIYYPIAAKSIEPFDCELLDTGIGGRVLEAEPSIECGKGAHVPLSRIAIVLVWPGLLGWPLVNVWAAYHYRDTMRYIQQRNMQGGKWERTREQRRIELV